MEPLHFSSFLMMPPATIYGIWCFVLIFPYLLRASKSTCIPDICHDIFHFLGQGCISASNLDSLQDPVSWKRCHDKVREMDV